MQGRFVREKGIEIGPIVFGLQQASINRGISTHKIEVFDEGLVGETKIAGKDTAFGIKPACPGRGEVRPIVREGGQSGIGAAPRLLPIAHSFSPRGRREIPIASRLAEALPQVPIASRPIVDPLDPPRIEPQRGSKSGDQVIFHNVIAPAGTHDRGAADFIEDVSGHPRPTQTVVQVDAVRFRPEHVMEVMDEVGTDLVAPVGPLASGVDGPGVVTEKADVVDFVRGDHMVVSAKNDRGMGGVGDQIIRHTLARSLDLDGRGISPDPAGATGETAIPDKVLPRFELGPRTAGQESAGLSTIRNLAISQSVPAAADRCAVGSRVAQRVPADH